MKARNVTLFSILGVMVFLFFSVLSSSLWAASPAPAVHTGDPAGGDLDGTYPNPTIRAGVLCEIESTQSSSFLSVPLGQSPLTILSLSVTTNEGQKVKLDSMAHWEIGVDSSISTSYSYSALFLLYRDGVVIGPTSLREFGQDDNIATDRNIEIIPNLTWVDIPVPGQHTYE